MADNGKPEAGVDDGEIEQDNNKGGTTEDEAEPTESEKPKKSPEVRPSSR